MKIIGNREDCTSQAEKDVFDALTKLEDLNEYTAIFNLTRLGAGWESDVVLIGPVGLLVLEIKGGVVYREGGAWFSKNRHGVINGIKDPTRQATDNMYKVLKSLSKSMDTSRMYFGEAVVLPDNTSIEEQLGRFEHLYDSSFITNTHKTVKELVSVHDGKRVRFGKPKFMEKDVDRTLDILLPDLGYVRSIKTLSKNNDAKYLALNDQQYNAYRLIRNNQRISVEGPAGSGKTILALNIAKQNEINGIETLLLCYSPALASFLDASFKEEFPEHEHVTITDIHSLFAEYEGSDSGEYYEEDGPVEYNETIHEYLANKYKELIIDEAQDLFSEQFFYILDTSLVGGLQDGRWVAFTDTSQRGLYSNEYNELDLYQMLQGINHTVMSLDRNMRNTDKINDYARELSSIDPGDYSLVQGVEPETIHYKDSRDQYAALKLKLQNILKTHGYKGNEISVVSVKEYSELIDKLAGDTVLGCKFKHVEEMSWKKREVDIVSVGTSYSFKGLENKVILVVDVENVLAEDLYNTLNYIGTTRAKEHLVVFIKEQASSANDNSTMDTMR